MTVNLYQAGHCVRFFYPVSSINLFSKMQPGNSSKKEGKRDTPCMAVGKRSFSEPDSSKPLRTAGFFAGGEKEGKRDTLNV